MNAWVTIFFLFFFMQSPISLMLNCSLLVFKLKNIRRINIVENCGRPCSRPQYLILRLVTCGSWSITVGCGMNFFFRFFPAKNSKKYLKYYKYYKMLEKINFFGWNGYQWKKKGDHRLPILDFHFLLIHSFISGRRMGFWNLIVIFVRPHHILRYYCKRASAPTEKVT